MSEQTDLDRFRIDPTDPFAAQRATLATHLLEDGVPLDDIRSARDLTQLGLLTWSRIYGIRGDRIDVDEAADRAGLKPDQVERILRALGFPSAARGFGITEADVEILRLFREAAQVFGEDEVVNLARVIGQSLSRIAEAVAASIRVNLEAPLLQQTGYGGFLEVAGGIADELLPRLAGAMDRIVRYHLLFATEQDWKLTPEGSAVTLELAVGFADMVGFTTRSSQLSLGELTTLIDRFEGSVTEAIAALGGRAVKFIGDEVMFAFLDPYAACAYSLQLVDLAEDESIPDIRVGLAFGEVVSRYGDYYGPVVNIASRLVENAPSCAVLVSTEMAHRVGDVFPLEEQPPLEMKGVDEPLPYYLLRPA